MAQITIRPARTDSGVVSIPSHSRSYIAGGIAVAIFILLIVAMVVVVVLISVVRRVKHNRNSLDGKNHKLERGNSSELFNSYYNHSKVGCVNYSTCGLPYLPHTASPMTVRHAVPFGSHGG